MKRQYKILSLILIIILIGVTYYQLNYPNWPTEKWSRSNLNYQGHSQEQADLMIEDIESTDWDINSMVIVKNGFLCYEHYKMDYDAETQHHLFSATKSITATLIGIAIKEGYLESVNMKVLPFFTDIVISNVSSQKESITIEHLLIMASGLEWNESDSSPENNFIHLTNSLNPIEYVLNQPMVAEPGTIWNYNTGTSHLLSAIINRVTNMTTLDFANTYLFEPLGIDIDTWFVDYNDLQKGGVGLHMNVLDMAKIGLLYLRNGTWDGREIISEDWVKDSSTAHIAVNDFTKYGYQWWVYPSLDLFTAQGYGGQMIMVFPDYDMTAIFTSSLAPDQWPFIYLAENYLIEGALSTNLSLVYTGIMLLIIYLIVIMVKKRRKLKIIS